MKKPQLLVGMSVFLISCAPVKESIRVVAVGQSTESEETRLDSKSAAATVEMRDSRHVVRAWTTVCDRTHFTSVQPLQEVVERTTDPSAGALALYGLGALAAGGLLLLAPCRETDPDCPKGRALGVLVGAGSGLGLEISALVEGIRSIDRTRPHQPEIHTWPDAKAQCHDVPTFPSAVHVVEGEREVDVGQLDERGELVLSDTIVAQLTSIAATHTLRLDSGATAKLDLTREREVYCSSRVASVQPQGTRSAIARVLEECRDTTAGIDFKTYLAKLEKERQEQEKVAAAQARQDIGKTITLNIEKHLLAKAAMACAWPSVTYTRYSVEMPYINWDVTEHSQPRASFTVRLYGTSPGRVELKKVLGPLIKSFGMDKIARRIRNLPDELWVDAVVSATLVAAKDEVIKAEVSWGDHINPVLCDPGETVNALVPKNLVCPKPKNASRQVCKEGINELKKLAGLTTESLGGGD